MESRGFTELESSLINLEDNNECFYVREVRFVSESESESMPNMDSCHYFSLAVNYVMAVSAAQFKTQLHRDEHFTEAAG
uniref:Uncharacterized protein n=1 Tax=Sphaerodactylus townsendi TaxID=933632 RepID=A0ACB8F8N4_9SAUR